ncbi:MAG: tetratricopeptide repeat protein [Thermodesulfovibrionales bacterium]
MLIHRTIQILILIAITLSSGIAFADAERIFIENSKAVVVVVTFNQKGEAISQGSGFIVREDGVVVTNYHVISNAASIKIKAGVKVLNVEGLLYIDKENDLVILKADDKNLPTVKLGDADKAGIGEKVYVIGSPQGLENTVSDGILSGIREIGTKWKILQITAPLSQGSSGGPVFNKNGEVIGIATFIVKEAQNLNFAMPVNVIKDKISVKKVIALQDAGIEDYTKSAEYWFYLGVAYSNSGRYKEAIEAFKQVIRINPDYAEAHYNLGVTYGKSGMDKEAIEAYKQAIRIDPDFANAHVNLGNAYVKIGMPKEATEAFKQAIRINPDDAKLYYLLGLNYYISGRYKEAIEAFKQSIRINPDYAEAHYNLGLNYGKSGMHREAIEAFKQSIRINPDFAKAHYNLGLNYHKLEMYKEAIEAYKQSIRINPDDAGAHYILGLAYLILNDSGSALEQYKILKSLEPELANKLFNLIYK